MNSAASQGGCQRRVIVQFLKPMTDTDAFDALQCPLSFISGGTAFHKARSYLRVCFRQCKIARPAAVKYDPTWRSAIRTKVRVSVLSCLNKRENSNQRLTCMVYKLMQFRPKKARRELRCAHEIYFYRLAFSIVFSSRQCQTPKNKTPIAP